LSNIAHLVGVKWELKERRNEGSDCMDEMKALRYDVGIEGGYIYGIAITHILILCGSVLARCTLGWILPLSSYSVAKILLLKGF
jgi:hypothetical protein